MACFIAKRYRHEGVAGHASVARTVQETLTILCYQSLRPRGLLPTPRQDANVFQNSPWPPKACVSLGALARGGLLDETKKLCQRERPSLLRFCSAPSYYCCSCCPDASELQRRQPRAGGLRLRSPGSASSCPPSCRLPLSASACAAATAAATSGGGTNTSELGALAPPSTAAPTAAGPTTKRAQNPLSAAANSRGASSWTECVAVGIGRNWNFPCRGGARTGRRRRRMHLGVGRRWRGGPAGAAKWSAESSVPENKAWMEVPRDTIKGSRARAPASGRA